ncbi:MAG TPA: hypothetical protein VGM83_18750 [Devosiaceae bacterium]|jgi:Zn-dependent protease
MIPSDLTVDLVVMRLIAGVIMAVVQALCIAAMAGVLGDKGPRYDGRLTVWPWGHVALLGLGALALSGLGWGRPVAVEAGKLRFGRWGLVLVVLAGSVALLLLGFLLPLLVPPLLKGLDYTAGVTLAAFIRLTAQLCVWVALFSLLPIPPLAGAHFLTALGVRVPERTETYLGLALFVVTVLGISRMVIRPVFNVVAPLILGPDIALG